MASSSLVEFGTRMVVDEVDEAWEWKSWKGRTINTKFRALMIMK